ncbi:MAG: hypothetical protein Q8N26_02395 [Myxococcales bacterium]|nr:hypothetical protein [Myxococcales bacterium]
MKLVIAPEPAAWVEPLIESLPRGETVVFAPWRQSPRAWRVARGLARRTAAAVGGGAELALSLELRRAFDAIVSTKTFGHVTHVFAPSLSALRVFAKARHAERVLLLDLPLLRHLHADLDAAALAVPTAAFLQNYRAKASFVVRQEEELVLASRVLVTSRLTRQRLRKRGVASERLGVLPMPARPRKVLYEPTSPHVLLAGTTASRFGLEVALAAIEQVPGVVLCARRGPGSSESMLRHPRLRLFEHEAPAVRAVIAPAWVESFCAETGAAAAAGLPVVATDRALGWLEQHRNVTVMGCGDVEGLRHAIATTAATLTQPMVESRTSSG